MLQPSESHEGLMTVKWIHFKELIYTYIYIHTYMFVPSKYHLTTQRILAKMKKFLNESQSWLYMVNKYEFPLFIIYIWYVYSYSLSLFLFPLAIKTMNLLIRTNHPAPMHSTLEGISGTSEASSWNCSHRVGMCRRCRFVLVLAVVVAAILLLLL